MQKSFLVAAGIFASVLAINSDPLMAQTTDVGAKTDQDLAKENAALRKRIRRLELERQNAELGDRVRRLETEKGLVAGSASTDGRVEPLPKASKQARTGSAAAVSPAAASAYAAFMPVYKAPAAAAVNGNLYFSLDSMYDRVHVPAYSLGMRNVDATNITNIGPLQTYDPGLNGVGVRSAIGYFLPGTSTRFELGGSYVGANGSQSQFTTTTATDVAIQLISGRQPGSAFVGPTFNPTTSGNFSTDYSAWQFNGKVANDWKYGLVTVTPSLAVFGGNTRVGQALTQSMLQPITNNRLAYSADTTERWTDIGARVGVDVSAPVTTALTVGIGSWVGVANRRTSLSGNDTSTSNNSGFNGSSTLSINDNKNVFLANVEGGFAYKLTQIVALRGFAGLNYDGSVPGIAPPSFTGGASTATSTTAASIYYAHETSYYAGGGVLVKW
jgi:hypothetical protein